MGLSLFLFFSWINTVEWRVSEHQVQMALFGLVYGGGKSWLSSNDVFCKKLVGFLKLANTNRPLLGRGMTHILATLVIVSAAARPVYTRHHMTDSLRATFLVSTSSSSSWVLSRVVQRKHNTCVHPSMQEGQNTIQQEGTRSNVPPEGRQFWNPFPRTSCVNLEKLLDVSEPWSPRRPSGNDSHWLSRDCWRVKCADL